MYLRATSKCFYYKKGFQGKTVNFIFINSYIVHILQWNLVLHVIYFFNFCIETAKVFVPKLLFLNFFSYL